MNGSAKKSFKIRRWWITLSFCFPYWNLFIAYMFTIWSTQLDKRNDFRQAKFRGNWLRCVNPSRIQNIRCDTVLRLPITLFAMRSLKWTRQTGRAKPYAQSLALLSLKFPFQIDEFQQYLHKTSFLFTSETVACPNTFHQRKKRQSHSSYFSSHFQYEDLPHYFQ